MLKQWRMLHCEPASNAMTPLVSLCRCWFVSMVVLRTALILLSKGGPDFTSLKAALDSLLSWLTKHVEDSQEIKNKFADFGCFCLQCRQQYQRMSSCPSCMGLASAKSKLHKGCNVPIGAGHLKRRYPAFWGEYVKSLAHGDSHEEGKRKIMAMRVLAEAKKRTRQSLEKREKLLLEKEADAAWMERLQKD